ncbi:partial Serralysin, partial [Rhodocyclaceae bacterium]
MTTTTSALDGLLAIRDGELDARWNYVNAIGTTPASPGGVGSAVTVTYSFLGAVPSYSASYPDPIVNFSAFSDAMRTAALSAMSSIQAVANITFQQASSGTGNLTFGMNYQDGSLGYAYYPNFSTITSGGNITSVTASQVGGDVWISTTENGSAWTTADFQAGGTGLLTLVHELGHAIGL